MTDLLARAIIAHDMTTDKGAVADALPLSAVYGLLDALESGSTDGIRMEDRRAFGEMFADTKEIVAAMNAGNDVLVEDTEHGPLMKAGFVSFGYKGGHTERHGSLTLTDRGKRWAERLAHLLNSDSAS
jgi:hypothetical protein